MRVLRRPMFRSGGSLGEGITSGLIPKRGRVDGPGGYSGELTTEERLRKAAGQQPDTSLSDFLINFGLNLASTPPTGSIFSTAAGAAKEPYQGYKAAKAERAAFDRQIGLEAAKMDIGHEQDIDIEKIKNDPARTATGLKIKELRDLYPDGGPEYDRRLKDILAGTSTEKDIAKIAAALISSGQVAPEDAAKQALRIWLSIQAGISMKQGGRVKYQQGMSVQPQQASMQQASMQQASMQPPAPGKQESSMGMPYEQFRASIPPEVSDEIVQLIYYNEEAFADFAQITTQSEIDAFNQKYGVTLVLPMST